MRIGIDARFYGSLGKGLGRYTEKLIEYLEDIDQENDYIIFLRAENYAEYQPKNPRFTKVLAQYAWYGFSEQCFFPMLLYRLKLDLMHFPHFNVPLLYRRRFVVTIHDLILLRYPTLRNTTRGAWLYSVKYLAYRFVIASAIARASHIITVSHFTESDIIKRYPQAAGKISVTYEAADPLCQILSPSAEHNLLVRIGLSRPEENKGQKEPLRDILKPYFLYVGNAYPHKNLELLLVAAKLFPNHIFLLVGKEDYFYARLKVQAVQERITNVIFAGFLTDGELSTLYRLAQVYLFPSLYEGFGLPPLEAMSRGLPVLASRSGSLPEILGEAALYFDATDIVSFEQVLRSVLDDPLVRIELRQRGYRQVARYSFREMAYATAKIYQEIFENK